MSSMLEKIDELLEQYDVWQNADFDSDKTAEEVKPRFEVTDKSSAEWVMRKIAKIQAEQKENDMLANEQIAPLKDEIREIEEWQQNENKKLQRHIDFLKSFLEPYHRRILEVDPKAKTIKLPHGDLCVRKQQPEIKRNDEILLDWLIENEMHNLVKVKKSPDWAELKKDCTFVNGKAVLSDTGQIVDGVEVIERPEKFEVVVK